MAEETPQERLARLRRIQELRNKREQGGGLPATEQSEASKRAERLEASSMGQKLLGAAETGLSFGAGALTEIGAGYAGIGSLAYNLVTGEDEPALKAADTVRSISEMTYSPKTQAGQDIMATVAQPFQLYGEGAQKAGEFVQDVSDESGLPQGVGTGLATATRSGIELAPSLLGARSFPARRGASLRERRAETQQAQGYAEDIGLDPGADVPTMREQIVESGRQQSGGRGAVARDFEGIASSIQEARNLNREMVSRMYDEARATSAGLPVAQAREFVDIAKKSISPYMRDLDSMPRLRSRLEELDEIAAMPENSIVKMNAIADWRESLNRVRPPQWDESQAAAISTLKGQLDSFLDAQYNRDMITGNPAAIQKWKEANKAYQQYARQFKDNKVIRDLAKAEATPEEFKNWIYGTSAVGAKKSSADVVKRIKNIVGQDSKQFQSLRQEAVFDIVEPLLRSPDEVNFKQFADNYDKFVRNNPSLRKELFGESMSDLEKLRSFASAVNNRTSKSKDLNIQTPLLRLTFGNVLSRNQAKLGTMDKALTMVRNAATKSDKRKIMAEVMGYDPLDNLLPTDVLTIGGGVQAGIQQSAPEAEEQ